MRRSFEEYRLRQVYELDRTIIQNWEAYMRANPLYFEYVAGVELSDESLAELRRELFKGRGNGSAARSVPTEQGGRVLHLVLSQRMLRARALQGPEKGGEGRP